MHCTTRGTLLLISVISIAVLIIAAEQEENVASEGGAFEDGHLAQKEVVEDGSLGEEGKGGSESGEEEPGPDDKRSDIERSQNGSAVVPEEAWSSTSSSSAGGNASEEEGSRKTHGRAPPSSRVRVRVNCWDYRKIEEYKKTEEEAKSTINLLESPGNKGNGTEAQAQTESGGSTTIEGEEGSILEPAEEGGATPLPVHPEEKNGEETETGSSDIDGEEEENDPDVDPTLQLYSSRTVEIVNMTHLMGEILVQNSSVRGKAMPGNCTLVLFYTTWCPFSAKAAPHFNALPRAYPPLTVAAIDVQKHKTVNTFFGILGVPTVALFHNGRLIAKFNESKFTLNKFAEFIEYFTDLKAEEKLNVTSKDFEGPLSSVPQRGRDWMLLVAWIFLIVCFAHYITKSAIWWRFVEFVRTTWREAELQVQQPPHEHND